MSAESTAVVDAWQCTLCTHVYDPTVGDPEHGIAPGTPFAALPADWHCPECGMEKNFYQRIAF